MTFTRASSPLLNVAVEESAASLKGPGPNMNVRSVLRHAIRTLAAQGATLLAIQLAGILIVRMLGVAGRGEVAAAVLIPTIIAYGGWLGLPAATGYLINAQPAMRLRIIATARTLSLLLSLGLILLSLAITAVVSLPSSVRDISMVFAVFIPLNLYISIHQAVLQADLRSVAFNVVRVSGALFYLLILVGLDVLHAATPTTVVLAQIGGNIMWLMLSMVLASTPPWFALDRHAAREILAYGARAHLGTVSPVDSLRLDQLILALFLSTYDLGLYVIAMTFVTANRMIGTSVGMVAFPVASRNMSAADRDRKRRLILGGLVAGVALLTILIIGLEVILGRELLRLLFDVTDSTAYQVLCVLVIGSFFMNMRQVCADVLRGFNRPGVPTLSELVSMVTLSILAIALWSHGVIGVAWAVTISAGVAFSFVTIAGWGAAARHLPNNPFSNSSRGRGSTNTKRVMPVAIVVLGSVGSGGLVGILSLPLSLSMIGALVAVVCTGTLLAYFGIRGVATIALFAAAGTLAMNGFRVSNSVAISDIFFLVAALALIPMLANRTRCFLAPVTPLLAGTLLMATGGLIGTVFANITATRLISLGRFTAASTLIPIVLALWTPSYAELKRLSWLWVSSSTISALVALLQPTTYPRRPVGLSLHSNQLAATCVLAIGPAIVLTMTAHGAWRWIGAISCVLLSIGVVISGSRAGLLGCSVVLLTLCLLWSKRRALVGALSAASICLLVLLKVGLIALPSDNAIFRLFVSMITSQEDIAASVQRSNDMRNTAFHQSLRDALGHPFTGTGFDFAREAHNVYLLIWSSAGILGVVGFILVIRVALRVPLQSLFGSKSALQLDAMSLILGYACSFAGFLAADMFQPILWERYMWMIPAVIAVLSPYALAADEVGRCSRFRAMPPTIPKLERSVSQPLSGGGRGNALGACTSGQPDW